MNNQRKPITDFSQLAGKKYRFIKEWRTPSGNIPSDNDLYVLPLAGAGNAVTYNGHVLETSLQYMFRDLILKEEQTGFNYLEEVQDGYYSI